MRPPERDGGGARRFGLMLAGILVLAFTLRAAYTLAVTRHDTELYDQTYYELQARDIAQHHALFDDPFVHYANPDVDTPAADHPPLTVITLLPAALIHDSAAARLAMRFTTVLLGVAVVGLVALVGREVGGETVGLVAGAIAAVDPNLWMNDGLIMSESLAVLLTVALTFVAVRRRERARSRYVIAMGVLTGLLLLTRAELGLLVPLVVVPVLWRAAHGDRRRAVASIAATLALAGLVIAPWVMWNVARFERPVTISTGDGIALAAGSCDAAYYGPRTGWADVFECTSSATGVEQSVWDEQNRQRAFDYIREHLGRMPVVALARVGRAWGVWAISNTNDLNAFEGRPTWASWLGDLATWVLVPLAVYGGVVLRQRRQWLLPLVAPVIAVTLVLALIAGGLPRYRAPAEPSIIVLAAVAAVVLAQRRRSATPET